MGSSAEGNNDGGPNGIGAAVENRADEIAIDSVDEDESDNSDIETAIARKHQVTRSGRASHPFNYKRYYPGTAHLLENTSEGKWLKPYYYDNEDMVEKLGTGIFYQETCFSSDATVDEVEGLEVDAPIERWSDKDQYQLYHKALQWLDHSCDEIEGLCLKIEQYSIQKGVKVFGEKGKESAMKEMRSLAIKNQCFEEIDYDKLSQEDKDKALPLLMLIVLKRDGILKSRGVANRKLQKSHSDIDSASPAPAFCAVKYACATAAKEERDTASIDLPSFFLQTEADEDDEKIIIKFAGAVALLLVEVDERWHEHSCRENGKWIIIFYRRFGLIFFACMAHDF